MRNRRAVGANGRGLAFERVEPAISPLGELDVRLPSKVDAFDFGGHPAVRDPCLSAFMFDGSLLCCPLAQNDVANTDISVSAARRRSIERAESGVSCLRGSNHLGLLCRQDM